LATFALAQCTSAQASGDLQQKAGIAVCVSEDGFSGLCADGTGLYNATAVVVSPDGRNAYATGVDGGGSPYAGSIVTFDRDLLTGALAQKPGAAGCTSRNVIVDCKTSGTINRPVAIAVSPDGKSFYVADSNTGTLSVFDRDTATGELTQKAGAAGCFFNGTFGSCTTARGLQGPRDVEVSPNGQQVYVASLGALAEPSDEGIAVFDRDTTTGALTQKAGNDGCVSDDGNAGSCEDGLFVNPATLAISPNGKSLYAGSRDVDSPGPPASPPAINVFDIGSGGALTQKASPEGCITETGDGGLCLDGRQIKDSNSLAVSLDGKNLYVSGDGLPGDAPQIGSLTVFDRDGTTGDLNQKAGAAGCFTFDGDMGACSTTIALDRPQSLVVAASSVYVSVLGTNQGNVRAIVNLDRNESNGSLVQKPGAAGCLSSSSLGACTIVNPLGTLRFLALSPAGDSLYAAAAADKAITVFDRDNGVAPLTTIDSGPQGDISQNDVSFEFSASEPGAVFECSLDGAAFSTCVSPQSYADLAVGAHVFRVKATDTWGNVEASPPERNFTVLPPGAARLAITGFNPSKPKVKRNRSISLKVVTRNTGAAAASNTKVCVSVSRALKKSLAPRGKPCVILGTLAAGASRTSTFTLKGTGKVKRGTRYKVSFKVSATGVSPSTRKVTVIGR
jgi:DNA-binding beta-propeller fold protein YncE